MPLCCNNEEYSSSDSSRTLSPENRYANSDPEAEFYNRLTSFEDDTPVPPLPTSEHKSLKSILSRGSTKGKISLASTLNKSGSKVTINETIEELEEPPEKPMSKKDSRKSLGKKSILNKLQSRAVLTGLSSAKGNVFSFFKRSSKDQLDQKHDLLAHFKNMDSDGSGFVDQLELSHYILGQFGLEVKGFIHFSLAYFL